MAHSFKYVFVKTKPSWFIGSCHSSLSFSSDGKIIAGSMAMNSPNHSNGKVGFWETATGSVTWSINDWSFVVFSPTDPDMGIIVGSKGIQPVKRNSPEVEVWNIWGSSNPFFTAPETIVFGSDGKTVTAQDGEWRFYEFDSYSFPSCRKYTKNYTVNASSVAYCPLEPKSFIVGRDNGQLEVISFNGFNTSKLHCQLHPVRSIRVSACAWSQDRKWIATGNDVGDIHLWSASASGKV
ncbi:hypothetical protein BYT27DRAFT_7209763 [Phlegmacium glaucopus]|nr:hypothetical protein BYT27DRAFT_7209763 [Phlegmacium glaucopus]